MPEIKVPETGAGTPPVVVNSPLVTGIPGEKMLEESTSTEENKDDGSDEGAPTEGKYSKMKQPELKEELTKRNIATPAVVSNKDLIKLLEEDDAKKATLVETEVKNDGSEAVTLKVTQ